MLEVLDPLKNQMTPFVSLEAIRASGGLFKRARSHFKPILNLKAKSGKTKTLSEQADVARADNPC